MGALLECLVQSHDGAIRLLPALPPGWGSGRVRGVRARPGVSVDLAWSDGVVTACVLTADRDVEVRVLLPAGAAGSPEPREMSVPLRGGVPCAVVP